MILEAMAYSVPVISSNCPSGPSDIIKHNDNGILFETNDVNGLSESLNHLARNKEIRERLAHNAKISLSKFDHKTITHQWLELLEK